MFLHGSWMHLLGNMWFLWLFGNNVESRIGHAPFALLYALGGLAAWIAHCAFLAPEAGYQPVIGASGAVAAVLGAYAVAWPHARIRCALFLFFILFVELPALLVLGIWFAMQIFSALAEQNALGGGVAWWAHVGGFVAGMAMMPIFASIIADPAPRRRETFWDPE
jgi:membrane associated rhomboid family serine protease